MWALWEVPPLLTPSPAPPPEHRPISPGPVMCVNRPLRRTQRHPLPPAPWHSASQQGSPPGTLGAEQVLGEGDWRHRGLGLPRSAHPGGAGGGGPGPTVPTRCRSGRPLGALLRGGASSSATGWRENKSRDLEAASTRRASLAKDAQLMNLKQIHGCV